MMSNDVMTIKEIYDIGREFFHGGHLRVEIWDIGVRFVWMNQDEDGRDQKKTAFYQKNLNEIDSSSLRGFLDAEAEESA